MIAPFSLHYVDLDAYWVARDAYRLRGFPGPAIRGAFGHALRAVGCDRRITGAVCEVCANPARCAFHNLFETPMPPGLPQGFPKSEDGPRPFVLDVAPLLLEAEPRDTVSIGLRVFGDAIHDARVVVHALGELGLRGIGNHNARLDLQMVRDRASGAVVWRGDWHPERLTIRELATAPPPPHASDGSIAIHIVTPLRIKQANKRLLELEPIPVMRAIWRRVLLLTRTHGGVPPDPDSLTPLLLAAADVQWRAEREGRFHATRYSNRQGGPVPMDGLTGRWRWRNVDRSLLPWLAAAPRMHIGSGTTFGFGAIRFQ